jgi:hypothetical protein
LEFAVGAVGFAGGAPAAAVEDEPVGEVGPGGAGEELDEVFLDADGVGEFGEGEALGETADMGVDDDAFVFIEGVSEDDIGGFASDTGKDGEGFEGVGDFAAVLGEEFGGHGADVFRLVAEEAGGADEGFEFVLGNGGVVGGGAAALKERGGDDVHALVGALGAEHRGDEEFQRVGVDEFAVGVRVDFWKPLEEFAGAVGAGHWAGRAWRRC